MPTTETKRMLLTSASNKDTKQKKLSFFFSARRQDVESSSSPALVESTSGQSTDVIVGEGMSGYTMFYIFFNV